MILQNQSQVVSNVPSSIGFAPIIPSRKIAGEEQVAMDIFWWW
jgi:hypothetical protein